MACVAARALRDRRGRPAVARVRPFDGPEHLGPRMAVTPRSRA
jgi:hypothetical protein